VYLHCLVAHLEGLSVGRDRFSSSAQEVEHVPLPHERDRNTPLLVSEPALHRAKDRQRIFGNVL
jgi:hypothetical protein